MAERVERNPPFLSGLREELGSVTAGGPVEFGSSGDPSRSADNLATEAATTPSPRARIDDQRLVLPGVSAAMVSSSPSLAALGRQLSAQLPYRGFRVRRDSDELVLEGKVNPWVRLATRDEVRSYMKSARRAGPYARAGAAAKPTYLGSDVDPGPGWVRVDAVTRLNPFGLFYGAVAPRIGGVTFDHYGRAVGPAGRVLKYYAVATLEHDPDSIVLGVKAELEPYTGTAAWSGGLPAPPGGNAELARPTAPDAIREEIKEELLGQYELVDPLGAQQGAADIAGRAEYRTHLATVRPAPAPAPAPAAAAAAAALPPANRETIGTAVVNVNDLAHRLGFTSATSEDDILREIARVSWTAVGKDPNDLAPIYTGTGGSAQQRTQWAQYAAADNFPMRTVVAYVKSRLPAPAPAPAPAPGPLPPP